MPPKTGLEYENIQEPRDKSNQTSSTNQNGQESVEEMDLSSTNSYDDESVDTLNLSLHTLDLSSSNHDQVYQAYQAMANQSNPLNNPIYYLDSDLKDAITGLLLSYLSRLRSETVSCAESDLTKLENSKLELIERLWSLKSVDSYVGGIDPREILKFEDLFRYSNMNSTRPLHKLNSSTRSDIYDLLTKNSKSITLSSLPKSEKDELIKENIAMIDFLFKLADEPSKENDGYSSEAISYNYIVAGKSENEIKKVNEKPINDLLRANRPLRDDFLLTTNERPSNYHLVPKTVDSPFMLALRSNGKIKNANEKQHRPLTDDFLLSNATNYRPIVAVKSDGEIKNADENLSNDKIEKTNVDLSSDLSDDSMVKCTVSEVEIDKEDGRYRLTIEADTKDFLEQTKILTSSVFNCEFLTCLIFFRSNQMFGGSKCVVAGFSVLGSKSNCAWEMNIDINLCLQQSNSFRAGIKSLRLTDDNRSDTCCFYKHDDLLKFINEGSFKIHVSFKPDLQQRAKCNF